MITREQIASSLRGIVYDDEEIRDVFKRCDEALSDNSRRMRELLEAISELYLDSVKYKEGIDSMIRKIDTL
ncbi:MAG: hypothetical protein ABH883_02905 [Candidatus Omnitrophota bacterium]